MGATSLRHLITIGWEEEGGYPLTVQVQGSISWQYTVVAVVLISVGLLTLLIALLTTLFAKINKTEQSFRLKLDFLMVNIYVFCFINQYEI